VSELPIARPLFGAEEEAAVARVLRSGWVMQGPEVEAFERELAAFCDAPFACAVSSGTAALELALRAAGVQPGDEVVTVSHSFIATANAIRLCGATPVFVDIERDTLNLDARLLDAAIGPRTRAVLLVHQLGMPADLPAVVAFCEQRGLALVEDAACALGSEHEVKGAWERIGRPRGAMACFSFHPRKLVTTGEGGMVTTRDAALDTRVRRLRQHGADPRGHFLETAPNFRLTDLQAAVGRVQLQRLPAQLAERRAQVERYRRGLAALPVDFPVEPAGRLSNWQTLCVSVQPRLGRPDAQAVVDALAAEGIGARRGVQNAHEQPAYADPSSHRVAGSLVESERAARHGLCLPLFPGLAGADIDRVVASLGRALQRGRSA
jgi:dTDP-4-amino-4,6-dideoxygalactose transaminase